MRLPNKEYKQNLKEGVTPWSALAATVTGKRYKPKLLRAMLNKYVPEEDYCPLNKDFVLEALIEITNHKKRDPEIPE